MKEMIALEKIVEAKENMNIGYIEWANDCIDEAIAELEALQSRRCEGCKNFRDDNHAPSFDGYCADVGTYIEGENELLPLDVDRGFCCNRYEPKAEQC